VRNNWGFAALNPSHAAPFLCLDKALVESVRGSYNSRNRLLAIPGAPCLSGQALTYSCLMLTFRPFRNIDPPALADIWRSRAGQPGLTQPVSVDLFEQFVFGKVYFDCKGLILAFHGDRPVGFAHAAFGPNEARDRIATDKGVTCIVMVRPDCAQAEVAQGLLERSEAYLHRGGAKALYGGAIRPLNPFYLGLYGGSELPGVLCSDTVARDLYRSHGYAEIDRIFLFRRQLSGFRAPVDHRQLQLRRHTTVAMNIDPPARSWWEACTTGDFDLTRFELTERGRAVPVASATYRDMGPRSNSVPGRMVGLLDLEIAPSHRGRGLATFILSESFRQLARRGVAGVEAQAGQHNPAAIRLCQKLGMEETGQGIVFRKEVG